MSELADHFGVEIVFVLNADTGYVFNLSDEFVRGSDRSFPGSLYPQASFISGVTAVGASPTDFRASCYHPHLEIAQAHGPCEVMIQPPKLSTPWDPKKDEMLISRLPKR